MTRDEKLDAILAICREGQLPSERATIAAIEGLRAADKVWVDMERTGEDFWVSGDAWAFDLLTIAHNQLDNIIAAYFPEDV